MLYRVSRKGNRERFVETDSLDFAKSLVKDGFRHSGYLLEIRVLKGNRWFLLKEKGGKDNA